MKTAEQLNREADECFRREQESFERCDTDGFLSQWANNITGRLKREQARIAENGGKAKLPVLLEGRRRVRAKLIDGKFGYCWLLDSKEAEKFGRKFIPYGEDSRIQKSLGLRQGIHTIPAVAYIAGSGTGLSGAATCTVVIRADYEKIGYTF